MKRLNLLVVSILFIGVMCGSIYFMPQDSDARMNAYIYAGSTAGSGGCTQTPERASEDFEAIADTEEWSNDGDWSENPSSTNYFVGDDARANGGSLSGLIDNATASNSYYIQRAHTAAGSSGYLTYDWYVNIDAVGTAEYTHWVKISDGAPGSAANIRVEILVNGDDLRVSDNASYPDVCTNCLSADTWHHIEVQIDLSATDGVDAVYVWMDGTQYGPYDTRSQYDPSTGIDQFNPMTYSNTNIWIDDLIVYEGERCAP